MTGFRAVFFDSGGTLLRPISGQWWPKPRLRELLSAAGLPVPANDRLLSALAAAEPQLARRQVMPTLQEELAAYVDYYETALGVLFETIPARLPHALAEAAVYELDQEPFEDTVPALERLSRAGLRLGIISNAGPSLELRHRDLGLRGYFDPFVVSAVVGCTKPGRRIYELALEAAALAPAEAIFVDDVRENVHAAAELGMSGYVIDRDGDPGPASRDMPTITDLTELPHILGV